MSDEKPFTAKDAKDLAGLSYRQLNDWDSRDAIPGERKADRSWRKFTPKDLFILMVCAEIRRLYGVPVEKTRYIRNFMAKQDANHFAAAVQMMNMGLHVFLLTDFAKTFIMDSDLEFLDLMHHGYFRAERTTPFIFLRLNEIVNRLLGLMKDPIELKPNKTVYDSHFLMHAISVHTQPEMDLLRAVRSGKFDRIEIRVQDGLIRYIDTEGDVASEDVESRDDAVNLKHRNEYETLLVNRRDGKIVSARRKLPRKYSQSDSDTLFVGNLLTENETKKTRHK